MILLATTIFNTPNQMQGATSQNAGLAGYVPTPVAGDDSKFLKGDGTWSNIEALPAVTSSDNGKVLRVVDGVWTVVSLTQANGVSF